MTDNPRLVDRQLVSRCLAGDSLAERALYDAHVERIYRLMHRMAGDGDLAADFTQETFIRAFERLDQFRKEGQELSRANPVGSSWIEKVDCSKHASKIVIR